MARSTSITAERSRATAIRSLLGRGIVVLGGLLLAGAGWHSFERVRESGGWIAAADRVRSGEPLPPHRLAAGIARLEALPDPDAKELGALTFLHYAAADAALIRGDRAAWAFELAKASERARRGLALAPGRADLAVALAEIDFLLGGPGPGVYRMLDLSYRTAPRDLWIVQRRIGLGLRLLAVAPPELADHIVSDIRILGEPFRDAEHYRILAQAAFVAGPAATAIVERELGRGHPWPFELFEEFLANYQRHARP